MAGRNVDNSLTAAQLREVLDYDPVTGIFRWRDRKDIPDFVNKRFVGTVAGSTHSQRGYLKIGWGGAYYFAQRLAWLYVTGEWPKHSIDHIDGDTANNAFANLRDVPHQHNMMNQKQTRGTIGALKGARFHKPSGRWQASIMVDGKSHYIGLYDTPEEAHAAYREAATRLHGKFARFD